MHDIFFFRGQRLVGSAAASPHFLGVHAMVHIWYVFFKKTHKGEKVQWRSGRHPSDHLTPLSQAQQNHSRPYNKVFDKSIFYEFGDDVSRRFASQNKLVLASFFFAHVLRFFILLFAFFSFLLSSILICWCVPRKSRVFFTSGTYFSCTHQAFELIRNGSDE